MTTPASRLVRYGLLAALAALAYPLGAAQAQTASRVRPYPGGERALERMRAADTNHDGAISRGEMRDMRKSNWGRMDRDGDGYFTRSDLPRFAQPRWDGEQLAQIRRELDADHDGRLSYAEFVNGPMVGFDMADTDGNGLVTKAELDAMAAVVRARHG